MTAKIGALSEVRRAAERILERTATQLPLEGAALADDRPVPYILVPSEALGDLRAALEGAGEHPEVAAGQTIRVKIELPELPDCWQFELEIPLTPDRRNALNKASRGGSWHGAAGAMKAEKARIMQALSGWATETPRYTGPLACEVLIEWGKSLHVGKSRAARAQDRMLDPDGAAAALKPWLDALTEIKVWADDRQIAGDFRIRQRYSEDGTERTTIRIRPLAEADQPRDSPVQSDDMRRVRKRIPTIGDATPAQLPRVPRQPLGTS